jgi:toxin secretion/phage lysis holin
VEENKRTIFNTFFAWVGSFLTYIFGGWDTCLKVLVLFILMDYLTGVLWAFMQKNVSSDIGRRGILKKATILIVLIVAVLLDRLINNDTWVFRTLVCYFYIANEGISLLENAVKIGVPVPKKLIDTLEQLKKKEEEF